MRQTRGDANALHVGAIVLTFIGLAGCSSVRTLSVYMGRYIIELDGDRYLVETVITDTSHKFHRAFAKPLRTGESVDGPVELPSDGERALLEQQLRTLKQAPPTADSGH